MAIPSTTASRAAEYVVDDAGRSMGVAPGKFPGTAAVNRYVTAFLATRHTSLNFLWRSEDNHWFSVRLERSPVIPGSQVRALVRLQPTQLPEGITPREIDVLTLVCLGLTNGQVAELLGNSARTVSTQIERLLAKLNQPSRAGLAAVAVDAGLLRLPVPGGTEGLSGLAIVDVDQASRSAPAGAPSQPIRRSLSRPRPFLLGSLLPLSGPARADGLESQRGAELAVAQINARGGIGGRLVEQVVASADFFKPTEVMSAVNSLLDREVDTIITSYASAESPEMLDVVADFGVPFLHNATFERQVELVRDDPARFGMVFQTCPSETYYGVGLVRLLDDLRERRLWRPTSRRLVAVELESLSTRTANEVFFDSATRSGWEVVDVVRIPKEAPNWRALVARVVGQDPAAVMVNHYVPDALVDFQLEFRRHRCEALIYCVYGPSIPRFIESAREAAEGVIWSTVTGTYNDAFGRAFRTEFETRHGIRPGWSQAGSSYDQVNLIAAAWTATGSSRPDAVVSHLRSAVYRGVNGVYYLGAPGQSALSYPDVTLDPSLGQAQLIYQVQDGQPRVLGPSPYGAISAYRTPPWTATLSA